MMMKSHYHDRVKSSPDWHFKLRAELSKAWDYDEFTGLKYINLERDKTFMNQLCFNEFCIDL